MDGDTELVARVRRGERDSFDDLYNRYADDVFSLCLVVLGDPAVAKAAAGTAFALVARTRLDPLSDPSELRSWLLELARGSALAWSGSPQARSVPIPHGVAAESIIDGAVVPAPSSLRVGLIRTFDRAAMAAAEELASKRLKARQPATSPDVATRTDSREAPVGAALAPPGVLPGPGHARPSRRARRARRAQGPSRSRQPSPAPAPAPAAGSPVGAGHAEAAAVVDRGDPEVVALPLPLQSTGPGPSSAAREWRTKPALAAAAAFVAVATGASVAVNWPSSGSSTEATKIPDAVVVVETSTAPDGGTPDQPPGRRAAPVQPAPVAPTVAGAYTRIPTRIPVDGRAVEGPAMAVSVGNGSVGYPAAAPHTSIPPVVGTPRSPTPPATPETTTNPPANPPPPATDPAPAPPPPTVPNMPLAENAPGVGGGAGMAPFPNQDPVPESGGVGGNSPTQNSMPPMQVAGGGGNGNGAGNGGNGIGIGGNGTGGSDNGVGNGTNDNGGSGNGVSSFGSSVVIIIPA
jgi:DNA-directed RNA polymerase specialized sigma24 family protein